MLVVGYPSDNMVDIVVERADARKIEEVFGSKLSPQEEAHREESFKDIEVALRLLREARDKIGDAAEEGISEVLADKIWSYYDEVDEFIANLMNDLERWQRE